MFLSDSGVFTSTDYACFDAEATRRYEGLDSQIVAIFDDRELEAWSIPAVISHDVLHRCGYFESFPDQVLTLATLAEPCLATVAKSGTVDEEAKFSPTQCYLTPAACLHIYPMLEARPSVGDSTITLRARVFRHEGAAHEQLVRLVDYSVREFVFVGSRKHVRASLEQAMQGALQLGERLGLAPKLVPASDNFYPTRLNQTKARLQRGGRRKHELVVEIGGQAIAIASFNDHDLHFSEAFGFADERSVVTGCSGFGLERWIAALLARADDGA